MASTQTPLSFVLGRAKKTDLCEMAQYYGLAHSGTKAEITQRLLAFLNGDLNGLVSLAGPWYLDRWNEFVGDALKGQRRRSFDGMQEEIKALCKKANRKKAGIPDAKPTEGSRIVNGRYKIIKALGGGGFGSAYAALDLKNPHRAQVVLKYSNDVDDDEFLRREIAKAFDLLHVGICRYYDYDEEPTKKRTRPFLVLEHGGDSLEWHFDQLGKSERFTKRFSYTVMRQMAAALDYAVDEHLLVHGDVNPGNVLVDRDEVVRLTDFGLAARLIPARTASGHKVLKSTAHLGMHQVFSAPEVLAGFRAQRSSDQYSLAVVFHAMMEGDIFDDPRPHENLGMLTKKQNEAMRRAMEPKPQDRFDTCEQFANALCGRK